MQALVFHGPWDLRAEKVDDPRPGPDDVLIRVVATGICGSDIHGFSGENGRRHPGQVMGHETVGRVEEIGAGVGGTSELLPGRIVTVNPLLSCGACPACAKGTPQHCQRRRVIGVTPDIVSAFADFMTCPARNVVPLPEHVPVEYGALVEPLAVGYHAARRGMCGSEDAVLVVGGGPIGQACLLAARRLGVERLVVSEPSPGRRAMVEGLGATALDPESGDLATAVTDALGRPADVVLDAVGSTGSIGDAIRCTGLGARIVLVGMNSPRVELPAYSISTEERTLIGSFTYTDADFRETAEWVATGPAGLERLVDGRVDMEGAPAAFTDLAGGASSASKVLVYPHGLPTDVSTPPTEDGR